MSEFPKPKDCKAPVWYIISTEHGMKSPSTYQYVYRTYEAMQTALKGTEINEGRHLLVELRPVACYKLDVAPREFMVEDAALPGVDPNSEEGF